MTGRYVQLASEGEHLPVCRDSSIDLSLRPLLERMFPLIEAYLTIASYLDEASRLERGLVSHALCAALRGLLKVRRRPRTCLYVRACRVSDGAARSSSALASVTALGVPGPGGPARNAVCAGIALAPTSVVLRAAHHGHHANVRRAARRGVRRGIPEWRLTARR